MKGCVAAADPKISPLLLSKLEPHHANQISERIQEPPPPEPELVDGEEHYHVSHIFDSRLHGRRRQFQYFVHFTGFPAEDREWVRAFDLSPDAPAVISFHRNYPDKPCLPKRRREIANIFAVEQPNPQTDPTRGARP